MTNEDVCEIVVLSILLVIAALLVLCVFVYVGIPVAVVYALYKTIAWLKDRAVNAIETLREKPE